MLSVRRTTTAALLTILVALACDATPESTPTPPPSRQDPTPTATPRPPTPGSLLPRLPPPLPYFDRPIRSPRLDLADPDTTLRSKAIDDFDHVVVFAGTASNGSAAFTFELAVWPGSADAHRTCWDSARLDEPLPLCMRQALEGQLRDEVEPFAARRLAPAPTPAPSRGVAHPTTAPPPPPA